MGVFVFKILHYISISKFGCSLIESLFYNKHLKLLKHVFGIVQLRIEMLGICGKKKCQLDATEVFIADLIACSTCFGHHYAHHQELKSIMQWLLRVVFCAVVFQVAGLVWS